MPKSIVHIGIVTYNSLPDLPDCFAAIRAQTYPHLRVAVLDNASTDGSPEWVATHTPETKLILSPCNRGFAAGHNRLIAAASLAAQDYYLALNPDVKMTPDYLDNLIRSIDGDDRIGWATGKLLWAGVAAVSDAMLYSAGHGLFRSGYAIHIGYNLPDSPAYQESREVFGAPGAAVLMKQAFIRQLSINGELYDETFFLYGEDTDLDWRARRQGWACWGVAEAVAYHRHTPASPDLAILAVAHRYLSVIKNAYLLDLLFYNLPLIVGHCVLRMITPRRGLRLAVTLLRHTPAAWRKRRPPLITRHEMMQWFRWSAAQPTGQPVTFRTRLQAFSAHLGHHQGS
ncbi:MAG: glycosyltransferase family 2 protein [Anaerolineae bacterium]|nr:glycosyltransferase family 2 protein [Anaerolineae bacterium]